MSLLARGRRRKAAWNPPVASALRGTANEAADRVLVVEWPETEVTAR